MEIIEGPLPAVRTVARCALLLGLLTASYAAYALHSPPCFLQCSYTEDDLDAAALPRRLLGCSAVQAAAAALSLLLPAGRARRVLAFLALAAGLAALGVLTILLSLFTCYWVGLAGYGDKLLRAVFIGEGVAVGVFIAAVVLRGFAAVLGQE